MGEIENSKSTHRINHLFLLVFLAGVYYQYGHDHLIRPSQYSAIHFINTNHSHCGENSTNHCVVRHFETFLNS